MVNISDLFRDSETLRSCFQYLRYCRHDVAVFYLLAQSEIDFDRPVRFVDLQGAAPLLVDPITIARQHRSAVQPYLAEMKKIVRDSAVDYDRVSIEEHYAEVLARLLPARKR